MNGIVLEDQFALEEHKRLLEDGKQISVAVRERNSHGRRKASRIQFGVGDDVGWVFYQEDDEGSEPRMILEEVLIHEVAELFHGYLERMLLRRCLVDPSPLSPEFVEFQPDIQNVLECLNADFSIQINPFSRSPWGQLLQHHGHS
jgi:hypothetical protein